MPSLSVKSERDTGKDNYSVSRGSHLSADGMHGDFSRAAAPVSPPVSWKRAFKANCSQVFFVVLAFFLMVTVGYLDGEFINGSGIINGILDFSKIESGFLELTAAPYGTARMTICFSACGKRRTLRRNIQGSKEGI